MAGVSEGQVGAFLAAVFDKRGVFDGILGAAVKALPECGDRLSACGPVTS